MGVGEITQREDTVYIRFVHLEMERVARAVGCKKGVKNVLFGGEGLFNTVITGPGKVTLQTMPVSGFAGALAPFMSSNSQ